LLSLEWCWCSCWLRLRHCVDWLNRLNGIAHARHLTQLPSTKGKLTLERGRKKDGKIGKRAEQKQRGLVRRTGRAHFSVLHPRSDQQRQAEEPVW
jgi:hypothetical protein